MVLRSEELHRNLQHLNGMLTTHEAARYLDLSYWHFMHLVEAGRIPGVRVVDRWLFSPDDLHDYRRSKYGALEDMARLALDHPSIDLTEKQAAICRSLLNMERPSDIARKLQQSRQAVHSQISLIKEKVSRSQVASPAIIAYNHKPAEATPRTKAPHRSKADPQPTPRRTTRSKRTVAPPPHA
ncbi:MAG: helix-turn-helix domain-containing protein [Ktedonobacteraceae bacterium]|nr:helix-turn-helix domain-containing protein [Ktedonobacteraceae bacterium]MBO0793872.1 helix-turn-helix domain-containing protein [Ktedonobacteraceae bacterium]